MITNAVSHNLIMGMRSNATNYSQNVAGAIVLCVLWVTDDRIFNSHFENVYTQWSN